MILDSLRYWVRRCTSTASASTWPRSWPATPSGTSLPNPPVLWDIESDPVLAGTKLIAEAWDAAGLYQVGSFVGDAWKEWNGRFRDDVRDFFRGDEGSVRRVADRLVGSPDIYGHKEREAGAERQLRDLPRRLHAQRSGLLQREAQRGERRGQPRRRQRQPQLELRRRGADRRPAVETLRNRQVKNFLTVTLISLGVPMILMGDEVRRTQGGNNNAYCQDNEISWFDWTLVEKHADVHRFVSLLIARRLLRDVEHERQRVSLNDCIAAGEEGLARREANQPDWGDLRTASRWVPNSAEKGSSFT